MQRGLPLDAIDSRVVLVGYAWPALGLGLIQIVWGLVAVSHPAPDLSGWAVSGGRLVGAGLVALAIARLVEALDRRRLLFWFAVAHAVVLLAVLVQWLTGAPAPNDPALAFLPLGMATMWLLAGWSQQGGDIPPLGAYVGLFGPRPTSPTSILRSEYEQKIRLAAAQEERNRLARDLHDAIKQQIFAIQTSAATAEARLASDPAGARDAIAQVRHAARESMAEMDAMLDQLRVAAIENTGLVEALKKQCEALEFRTGMTVAFEAGHLPPSEILPPGTHQALLRIAQEALSNIARHARARSARVVLEDKGSTLTLTIADDGSGFATGGGTTGMGLRNIHARAAECGGEAHVGSKPGEGTTVFVAIPLPDTDPRQYRGKLIWAAGALVLSTVLAADAWSRGRPPTLLLIMVPVLLGTIRYVLAWRRARRLQKATT